MLSEEDAGRILPSFSRAAVLVRIRPAAAIGSSSYKEYFQKPQEGKRTEKLVSVGFLDQNYSDSGQWNQLKVIPRTTDKKSSPPPDPFVQCKAPKD
jgi:hypothetical protein